MNTKVYCCYSAAAEVGHCHDCPTQQGKPDLQAVARSLVNRFDRIGGIHGLAVDSLLGKDVSALREAVEATDNRPDGGNLDKALKLALFKSARFLDEPAGWRWRFKAGKDQSWRYAERTPRGFDPAIVEAQPLFAVLETNADAAVVLADQSASDNSEQDQPKG